jgi:hypothetical protein
MTKQQILPTEKQGPSLDPSKAKIMLYGMPKIGKTTFASQWDDNTLLIAAEPGYGGIEAFVQPVITWEEFRAVGAALAQGEHEFTTVVIDTTDELFRMCQDYVQREHGFKHPSDLDYGKGWSILADEFRLRVGKLAGLGYGVIFISHAKDEEVKQRVGTINRAVPTLSGQAGKFLTGFVDLILFATMETDADGEHRVVRTAPSENWSAGGRVTLPDPLPLDATVVREALEKAS